LAGMSMQRPNSPDWTMMEMMTSCPNDKSNKE
jgi:hypothetical protein